MDSLVIRLKRSFFTEQLWIEKYMVVSDHLNKDGWKVLPEWIGINTSLWKYNSFLYCYKRVEIVARERERGVVLRLLSREPDTKPTLNPGATPLSWLPRRCVLSNSLIALLDWLAESKNFRHNVFSEHPHKNIPVRFIWFISSVPCLP